jgi:glycosyltransferase involved in cell wall biosynthesis
VIVDTGSTDNSAEIYKKRNAKVVEVGDKFAWLYDVSSAMFVNYMIGEPLVRPADRCFFFDQARNEVTKHATKDWCLALDIAQIITKINLISLEKSLREAPENVACMDFKITLNGSKFSSSRVYRRDAASWEHPVHELLVPFAGKKNVEMKNFEVEHIRKAGDDKNYIPMLAHAYFIAPFKKPGDQARRLFYFARELFYHKHWKAARKFFALCMDRNDNWVKERSDACCYWAETWREDQSDQDGPNYEDWIEKRREGFIRAINIFPGWRKPFLLLADMSYKQNDWIGTISYASQALRIKEQALEPLHMENSTYYTTEPYRLKYVGLIRLAFQMQGAGMDPESTIEEYLVMESKTGCSDEVFLTGWDLAMNHFLEKDKKRASLFFVKCFALDPKRYESKQKLFA